MNTQQTNPTVEAAAAVSQTSWQNYITPFATAIGWDVEKVTEALKPLVGDPGDEAIELLKSETDTPTAEFRPLFTGVASARLNKAVAKYLRSAQTEPATQAAAPQNAANAALEVLPSVPDDQAWLSALKTGGELKINKNTVIAGMRAALASRSGLFDIPAELSRRMESHAESLSQPVDGEFFKLQKMLTQRSYAEIFAALEIDGGRFVTQGRKNNLVQRLDEKLWPALLNFQNALTAWMDSWQKTAGNPSNMMGIFAMAVTGRAGGVMPPNMAMQPPPTDGLRDMAETVIEEINKSFAGLGIPVAMAMAYDALKVKEVLENPQLPMHVGAANREQMLKMLNVDVQADYVRLEQNITKYALGIMEFASKTAESEVAYISALLYLGSQIPWAKLGAPARRPVQTRRPYGERESEQG